MRAQLSQWLNRIEVLSSRERAMLLAGVPLLLLVAAEGLLFAPARHRTAAAVKETTRLQEELKGLTAVLAAQPAAAPLPAASQLLKERNELQGRVDAAHQVTAALDSSADWGTVVRATVSGTAGLTLTQLKTMPAELVFTPSTVKPAAPAGKAAAAKPSGAAASAGARPASSPVRAAPAPAMPASAAQGDSIYRHRAELTIKGDFGTLLGYLQTLQRVPGDLRWDRLQLSVAGYPQASAQLRLYTLSGRAETPFN
jgi:hypothetical protein